MLRFFGHLLSVDERADFYAKIVCALITTSNRELKDGELDLIAKRVPTGKKAVFLERCKYHLDLIDSGELHINQLIKRIDQISRQHPRWIKVVRNELLEDLVDSSSDLNIRAYEFLKNLKTEQSLVYTPPQA